eukprot:CAMPEP_0114551432 /NCGR_PEP_ID=MMETSP0114-20121206/6604_1 /TAXON_ID=31324 /ORGANISM="Goniomonas sp, Strain m" /LENGTH=137 /DNA_ID=CAMNT_0001736273 /DNA_START=576 /DNA_END=989 /DNA_ORIENTATION=+
MCGCSFDVLLGMCFVYRDMRLRADPETVSETLTETLRLVRTPEEAVRVPALELSHHCHIREPWAMEHMEWPMEFWEKLKFPNLPTNDFESLLRIDRCFEILNDREIAERLRCSVTDAACPGLQTLLSSCILQSGFPS